MGYFSVTQRRDPTTGLGFCDSVTATTFALGGIYIYTVVLVHLWEIGQICTGEFSGNGVAGKVVGRRGALT